MAQAWNLAPAEAYLGTLQKEPPSLAVPTPPLTLQPDVGPAAARLLEVLIVLLRPRRILEIGTSIGYAAIAMGRAAGSHGGAVLTLERDPAIAAVARENVEAAGLAGAVEVRVGDATALLPRLPGPFGLILQDGDKEAYEAMLDPLLERLEPGGVLVTDDVLFPVMDLPARCRPWQDAIERYNRTLASRPDLHTVFLPVGDGVAITARAAP